MARKHDASWSLAKHVHFTVFGKSWLRGMRGWLNSAATPRSFYAGATLEHEHALVEEDLLTLIAETEVAIADRYRRDMAIMSDLRERVLHEGNERRAVAAAQWAGDEPTWADIWRGNSACEDARKQFPELFEDQKDAA